MRHAGFPPIHDRRAQVLILGSFPSQRSLRKHQYYAHPQNGFWPIMGGVLGTRLEIPYAKRKRVLKKNRIALWDVIARARRPGSLDSSIISSSIEVNDFRRFFKTHPRIRLVCFNGGTAEALYKRLVLPALGNRKLRYRRLPSTSPAHAALSRKRKLARWRAVLRRPARRTKMPS